MPLFARLDRLIVRIGQAAAWLNLLLVAVILLQVILRYGFNRGLVPLEELMWHLYAVAFMFGLSHALVTDSHIRVDILSSRFSQRGRALIDIVGILFLLLPFAWVILDNSLEWVAASYRVSESSENPTGLPFRWLIKSVIPAAFLLLILAALSRITQQLALLSGGRDQWK